MTREFSTQVQQIAAGLVLEAGSGLHSIIREPGITCEVCATPLTPGQGYRKCYQCNGHSQPGLMLADRVGSLVYALEGGSQIYKIVQNYKAPAYAETNLPKLMSAMLALGLRTHYSCVRKLAGAEDQGWAVVPSTKGRAKLRELVIGVGAPPDQEVPVRFAGTSSVRALRPDLWAIDNAVALPQHVVVVDDSWVTGSNAQGLAAALKGVGVPKVSILVVARVMRPEYGPNTDFIRTRLARDPFDWRRCPWTGSDCPE